MTPSADPRNALAPSPASRPERTRNVRRIALGLVLVLLALAVAACGVASAADRAPATTASSIIAAPTATAAASAAASPAASTSPKATPTPTPTPLEPAKLGADPASFVAWLFNPIFQGLFLILAVAYSLTGNVLVAIVILTLLIRLVTLRLSARQIASQQRMYRLQPELKALQARFKGDRQALYQRQQEFYKERGVSPTAGCLPSVLQMGLLFPMYWVIRDGLTSFDPRAMFSVFGVNVVPWLHCQNDVAGVLDKARPCINTIVGGIDVGRPQVLFDLTLGGFVLGVSAIAIVSALLQAIQSRMLMPPPAENDPSASTQRSMMVVLPFISILYGGFLPAGLFMYWITTSLFSIVQQYLIVGWGSLFPIFGWTPAFARDSKPRFPVTMPVVSSDGNSVAATRHRPDDRVASAAATVRPRPRGGRQGRRGRRR